MMITALGLLGLTIPAREISVWGGDAEEPFHVKNL
jgi:hypothetical protein